jgi:succinyl-diaminopimelate desuccinylase
MNFPDKTREILDLAAQLIRIPSVTACPDERLTEVRRAGAFIFDYLREHGLTTRHFNNCMYPAVLAGFPDLIAAPVMLAGHFDVVAPEPYDSQFEPRIEGEYLLGRGAADMKTVVATYMVWMKDMLQQGPPYPPVNLLLVGNEENGEAEPMGTPHVLKLLHEEEKDANDRPYAPSLFIAGERTGEKGSELWGEICSQNRGIMRFDVIAHGMRGHSGVSAPQADLTERMFTTRTGIQDILGRRLTLKSADGWQTQARFPFIQVGTAGVYNITADHGHLGVEIRPIPQDDLQGLSDELAIYCRENQLDFNISVMENGIICNPDNPYLQALIQCVRKTSRQEPVIGRKLPGTSARFAPGGQGVVWGQSGIGPHAANERHFIPSILPYYQALSAFTTELIDAGYK